MSCKYIPSYIDRRVFVTGKESILNTHNFVEAGFLPRGGDANDVLVKCTSKDYHTKWDSLLNILTPLLPTLLQGIYTFRNGLTESPNFTIEWGGNLIRNTQITGQLLYNVDFRDLTGFAVKANTGNINLEATSGNVAIEAQSILSLSGNTNFIVETPFYATALQGALLQHTALLNGNVEYTPYGFPLVDGNSGQYLSTDGSGTLSWSTFRNKCEVLHFNDNPLNTTAPDGTILAYTYLADNYVLAANALSSNGSYIEVEACQVVTGSTGDIPILAITIPGIVRYLQGPIGIHEFTHIAKGKIVRISASTVYLSIEGSIYDSTNQLVTKYYESDSGSVTWSSPITVRCNFDLGIGDHVSELKHFSITKFLK